MVSLRRNLLVWLLCALTLGMVLLALASFLFTLEEMDEVFDDQLQQVALAALAQHEGRLSATRLPDPDRRAEAASTFVTQVWSADGNPIFSSLPAAGIPFVREAGLSTVTTKSGDWRVYTAPSANGVVQVAQPADARESLAADVALKLLIPSLPTALVIALLLVYALRRGLRPLGLAAEELGRKSATSLDPIPNESLPEELRPLVVSINALMLRLADALSQQRRFVADAAHELRTPLTALRMQLQVLDRAIDCAERTEAHADILKGLDRATHLVVQLLSLSRLEPDGIETQMRLVDLAELAQSVVGEFSERAERRNIDLGADAAHPAPIKGDPEQLRVLLNNLIDNALRYTPSGGRVDVSVRRDERMHSATVEICDTGTGIRREEREKVFQRFYRAGDVRDPAGAFPGTGLGLAIVKAIAVRHAAIVELEDGFPSPAGGFGLTVRIQFPQS
ncbi:MAG: two-component sensor histidine kinase [Proteobacteria bacterium]|nr:two-component sensor histidine kinase [Pseudomonadota bacterium]